MALGVIDSSSPRVTGRGCCTLHPPTAKTPPSIAIASRCLILTAALIDSILASKSVPTRLAPAPHGQGNPRRGF
jgi:hypothetical protein